MTPTPPTSSDGSALPPRHRPTLGNLAKDTTEMDLWAFEDDLDSLDDPSVTGSGAASDSSRPAGKIIPAPREHQGRSAAREIDDSPNPGAPAGRDELIRRNVEKIRSTIRTGAPKPAMPSITSQSGPGSDFAELDDWEDAAPHTPQPATVDRTEEVRTETFAAAIQAGFAGEDRLPESIEAADPGSTRERLENEFAPIPSPVAQPGSLRRHLKLSSIEKAGLIALSAMLLVAAVSVLVFALNRLPTESIGDREIDYPVKGGHLAVASAKTYWRKPVSDGPNPDTVRRDTELLPELELGITGGPAMIRVLFRNDEGAVVGDAVTRAVTASGTLKIPATAGFEDYGMYAAYTTGQGPPWTIEVYEAKAGSTAGEDFKKLLDLNISIERR